MLRRELDAVVSACVAAVGVDLNTADAGLLERLPGVHPDLAKAITDHRRRIGGFQGRAQLLEVPGMDPVTWRHVAAFLTVVGGTEPLDRTTVHPEDYDLARTIAGKLAVAVEQTFGSPLREVNLDEFTGPEVDRARVLGVVQALRHAGADPRGELTATVNAGVHTFDDLRPDLELHGRIANLTEFGAFVDLGIGQDGLIHISQIPPHRLRDPQQMLRVGEVVQVWLLHADAATRKISLTMHKPRHLVEGRTPTLGERLDRGQRRGRRPPRETQPVLSRAARTPESRRGRQRRPPLSADGKPEGAREGHGPAEAGGPREGDRPHGDRGGDRREARPGRRDDRRPHDRRPDDRRPDDRRPGDPRVFTVESERAVAETKGPRGELTSLASLRSLLRKHEPAPPAAAAAPTAPEAAVPPALEKGPSLAAPPPAGPEEPSPPT
jgi:predicted RNA-binding protein with RPS1 domain